MNLLLCTAAVLRLAMTKQFGSAVSAHYIKIGDGRLSTQLRERAESIIFNRDGRLRMLRTPTGQLTHNSSNYNTSLFRMRL